MLVRDRAGRAQVVIDPSNSLLQGREALGLSAESVVEVTPDGEAAVLHESRAGAAAVLELVRPALPRNRDRHGRAAADRYEDYVAALDGDTEPYAGYRQAFRCGMPPHGGFALGLERWTARLVGAKNVRETTLFPRDRNRLSP